MGHGVCVHACMCVCQCVCMCVFVSMCVLDGEGNRVFAIVLAVQTAMYLTS